MSVRSNMISGGDLNFIEQSSKRKNTENIVLNITVYACEIHFLWLQLIHFG